MDAQELIGKSMLRMEFVRGVEGAAPYNVISGRVGARIARPCRVAEW